VEGGGLGAMVVSGEISTGGGLDGLTDGAAVAVAILDSSVGWSLSQNYLQRARNGHTRSQNAEKEMEYLFYRFRKAEQKEKREKATKSFIFPSSLPGSEHVKPVQLESTH
jgi:hypothetical protein